MPDASALSLSVILVTPDSYQTVRMTVRHLLAQTVARQIELVLVTPTVADLHPDPDELTGFGAVRFVELGRLGDSAVARAEGIRQAQAPLVALAEDHSYPEPGWAEALIAAYAPGYAAVGPVIVNANPDSAVSWADYLLAYGPWADPAEAGPREHLPGHNSSYRRELLLSYGPRLDELMEAETLLHWDLRAQGHEVYLEPRARTHHMNFGLLRTFLFVQFQCGRAFAASRSHEWPLLRRAVYALLWPALVLRRLGRHFSDFRRVSRGRRLPGAALPILALGLLDDGLGQLTGYLFGAGEAPKRLSALEFRRYRYQPVPAPVLPGGETGKPG